MDDHKQVEKRFLQEQFEWVKARDKILEKIEIKLYEMRSIAEYARDQELSSQEFNRLNDQINELQNDVLNLQQQLNTAVH
ncbi:hypothetical protein [Virgibacillus sediminis]|uniref:Uncharacterized protein n=1 Tax=Virgibacillus sediminis TaxID=202260 RepID=A0ABV7A9C1_9BACI